MGRKFVVVLVMTRQVIAVVFDVNNIIWVRLDWNSDVIDFNRVEKNSLTK